MTLPETLYHYTDAAGFLGIVRDRTIWASSILHMNDAQEFILFRDKALSNLEKTLGDNGHPFDIDSFLPLVKDVKPSQYIFCLSEKGDLLSQWRGYCSGGDGFSIGFSSSAIVESLRQNNQRILKCNYGLDSDEARNTIGELNIRFIQTLDKVKEYEDAGKRTTLTLDAMVEYIAGIGNSSSEFKHQGFSEEKEWRLTLSPLSDTSLKVKYRTSQLGLIPYVEASFKDSKSLPISKIYIGPSSNAKRTIETVKNLLESIERTDIEVQVTEIPYRV